MACGRNIENSEQKSKNPKMKRAPQKTFVGTLL